jgi:PAT family beta-lactamase induction signal transducer AmpG
MAAHEETPGISPRKLPVWAMGLANMPTGFVYGFISTAMGILLVSRGVSVDTIGRTSFVAFSPSFWAWLLSPVLDVRFTKRFYGFFFAGMAALLLAGTVLSIGNINRFTLLLTASCTCAVLYSSCIGGWAPDALDNSEYNTMSGWFNVANLGAAGLFSVVAVQLVRHTSLPVTAIVLAALVLTPTALLHFFPQPRQPEGTLRANFSSMNRDLRKLLRGGRVWIGLLLFLLPESCFPLTNLFSSLGADFHAPENWVTGLNGIGVAIACGFGCLVSIPICRRFPRRAVYIVTGVGAALCGITMGLMPHTLPVYAAGLLGYNLFQGFNFTAFTALELEIVGPGNALAGTMMAVLTASGNFPISMMSWLDGHLHDAVGLRAMFLVDAGAAILTAAGLWLALPYVDRWATRREAALS